MVMPSIFLGCRGWKSILMAIQLVNQPMNADISGISNQPICIKKDLKKTYKQGL
jgi:hypothetical protein